ncbi:MAG: YraN family protein [Bacteroidaceae bacterium]|nr:YraN family protein [Bacteroidaceae bacterium]
MAEHNVTGSQGEDLAVRFLEEKGYQIVCRNWRNRGRKELDIVATKDNTLVFVEVKTRRVGSLSNPLAAVNGQKQHRLVLAANSFIQTHRIDMNVRFDVVAIVGTRIEHIENAFIPSATYY